MRLVELTEGRTKLIVPDFKAFKGPGSSKMPVFYNPNMEFNRDVSLIVNQAYIGNRRLETLDGLAGTGARGIRLANEIGGNFSIFMNDKNPLAYDLIQKNVALNKLEDIVTKQMDLNILLSEKHFDYIDIDPFGSPVKFIDAAFLSIRRDGMLAITATDTAPLCGTYAKTCLRRYGARTFRTSYGHEIGLRILLGYCAREAVKYDIGVHPEVVHYSDHYFRLYLTINKGAKRADKCLDNIGYIHHDIKTDRGEVLSFDNPMKGSMGPLWVGKLFNRSFLNKIEPKPHFRTIKRLEKSLHLWIEEADAPPTYYEINDLASSARVSPPKIASIIEKLKESGFFASRTHFSPTGLKTDAEPKEIKSIL